MITAPSTRRTTFAPVKRSTLYLVATVVGSVTWTFSSGSLPAWLPPLWSDANATSRDSMLLVGPIVAGAGAWIGGWRRTLAIGATPARGWTAIMTAQLRPLATAVVVGHVLGLTPAIVNTAADSTGGSVNPLAIISGVAGIFAVTCLGYLLGSVWHSRMAPVVAAIAVLPAIIGPILISEAVTSRDPAGTSVDSIHGVSLSWIDVTVGIGQHETLGGAAARTGLFTLLGISAVAVAIRSAGRSNSSPRLASVTPLAAPALVAVAILSIQPQLVGRSTGPLICEPVADSQICVEPEIMPVLPSLATGAAATVNQFGYGAATQDVRAGTPLSDLVAFQVHTNSPEQSASEAAITTARLISGEFACLTRAGTLAGDDSLNAGGALEVPYAFAGELSYAIAIRSTADRADIDAALYSFGSAEAEALARLSDTELRTFIEQHATQLANCEQVSVRP